MRTDSLVQLIDDYSTALTWLEKEIGSPLRGRLRDAEKVATAVSREYKAGRINDPANGDMRGEWVLVCPDVRWIVDIFKTLSSGPYLPYFIDRLKLSLDGAQFQKDERAGHSNMAARNSLFEVFFGTLLINAGATPLVAPGTNDGTYDIFRHPGFTECKRVSSKGAIRKSVKDAIKQLRRPILQCKHHLPFGLIGIEATKLLNDGSQVLVTRSEQAARSHLEKAGEEVYKELIREKLPINIAGSMIYQVSMVDVDGQMTVGAFWTYVPNPRMDVRLKPVIEKFQEAAKILSH